MLETARNAKESNIAQIICSTLISTKRGNIITFSTETTVKFASHEIGSLWRLVLQMNEDNICRGDALGSKTKDFRAQSATEVVRVERSFRTCTVDTERGGKEVYGRVMVRPLEPPPAMRADTAQTNVITVNK